LPRGVSPLLLIVKLVNVSGTNTPDIQLLGSEGRALAYRIDTKLTMRAFESELAPLRKETKAISEEIGQVNADWSRGIKGRPEALMEKITLTKCYILSWQSQLTEIHGCLQAKIPTGRATGAVMATLHQDQSPIPKRQQRLLDSGRRNQIRNSDGTVYLRGGPGGAVTPCVTGASSEELYAQIVDQHKRDSLNIFIKDVEDLQKHVKWFDVAITKKENEVTYYIELYGAGDLQKLIALARTLAQQHTGTDKDLWRERYRGHLEELKKSTTVPPSPEKLATEELRQQQTAAMRAAHEAQMAFERQQEQQRIRELRALEAVEASNDDEPPLAAVAAVTEPLVPMEVLSFDRLDLTKLTTPERVKFEAAITAIKNHELPADFRGNIKIEGVNVLHCGLGSGLRLYYTIRKDKLYVLDASNHDMGSLSTIVKKFSQEFDAK
jgi:hypothetical protein